MKRSTYIRWTLSALFVAFFLSSCYTQLAVVKKKKVYVYEEKQQPVTRSYERPSSDEIDTMYYEEDEDWENGATHITYNFYDYPPPVSWRTRYYDPFFYDDFYFYDSFYYSNYYWGYPPYGGWGWYRPVYIYDPYWHSDWRFAPGGPIYKQRPFARNGRLVRNGGRSTRVSTRSRSSAGNSAALVEHNRSRRTAGNGNSTRTIRRADDIRVIGTAAPGTGGRTGLKKGTTTKTVRKVVGNRKSRRSSRKYYPVSSSKKRRSTAKTVRSRKSRSVSKSRSSQPSKTTSKSYTPKRRSKSSSSSSRSRSNSSSGWNSGSSRSGSSYTPPARSSSSSRSSSRSSGSRSSRRR